MVSQLLIDVLCLGLWLIIFSHRWPPYHFTVLNRLRLALDYGIGWIYIVAAVLVMYYCGGIAYLINNLLPQVPNLGLSKSSPTFTPGTDGKRLWAYWLQVRCKQCDAACVCVVL
jgi:hypothetical protein